MCGLNAQEGSSFSGAQRTAGLNYAGGAGNAEPLLSRSYQAGCDKKNKKFITVGVGVWVRLAGSVGLGWCWGQVIGFGLDRVGVLTFLALARGGVGAEGGRNTDGI